MSKKEEKPQEVLVSFIDLGIEKHVTFLIGDMKKSAFEDGDIVQRLYKEAYLRLKEAKDKLNKK